MKKQTTNDWVTLDLTLGNPVVFLFDLPQEYIEKPVIEVKADKPVEVIPVIQRDRYGNVVARFDSIENASQATGIDAEKIKRDLKNYTAKSGYLWTGYGGK